MAEPRKSQGNRIPIIVDQNIDVSGATGHKLFVIDEKWNEQQTLEQLKMLLKRLIELSEIILVRI